MTDVAEALQQAICYNHNVYVFFVSLVLWFYLLELWDLKESLLIAVHVTLVY